MALLIYIKLQMVTVCSSTLLEQSTPLNYCGSLVAAFADTLHGSYLAGTMAGKIGKKLFDVDKKVNRRANWYEQARTQYRLRMRRQFLGSRGVMFWNRLSVMMSTLASQTKSNILKDQNVGAMDAVTTLYLFQVLQF